MNKESEASKANSDMMSSQNRQASGTSNGAQGGKRGFAAMNQQLQREIASKGGQAAHQKGTAHEFDTEEARRAGQKGGEVVSRDREHMAEIGRRGGESRQAAKREPDRSSEAEPKSGRIGRVSKSDNH